MAKDVKRLTICRLLHKDVKMLLLAGCWLNRYVGRLAIGRDGPAIGWLLTAIGWLLAKDVGRLAIGRDGLLLAGCWLNM